MIEDEEFLDFIENQSSSEFDEFPSVNGALIQNSTADITKNFNSNTIFEFKNHTKKDVEVKSRSTSKS